MDLTPIERPQAKKTAYIGYVKVPDKDRPVRGYEVAVAGAICNPDSILILDRALHHITSSPSFSLRS